LIAVDNIIAPARLALQAIACKRVHMYLVGTQIARRRGNKLHAIGVVNGPLHRWRKVYGPD
jgi:hypothetical protein